MAPHFSRLFFPKLNVSPFLFTVREPVADYRIRPVVWVQYSQRLKQCASNFNESNYYSMNSRLSSIYLYPIHSMKIFYAQ